MPLELHRDLILPPDATTLWRYMGFAKFIDLLETQTLWFPRTDQFEDPLEGTYTDAEIEHLRSLDTNTAHLGCGCRMLSKGSEIHANDRLRKLLESWCWGIDGDVGPLWQGQRHSCGENHR